LSVTGDMRAAETFLALELRLPRRVAPHDGIELQVSTGPLPRGARLVVESPRGQIFGAVAPFPAGSTSNSATIPIPQSALQGETLPLRLEMRDPDGKTRAPSASEVGKLDLVIVPQGE
jgi:hypothetical protein